MPHQESPSPNLYYLKTKTRSHGLLHLQGKQVNQDTNCYHWLKTNMICHLRLRPSQFSLSILSDSLRPHEPQHARPPCPSPTPRGYSNSCPSSQWCHPTTSSSVIPFSCPYSLPASGSFPMSQLFAWRGQSTNIQPWCTLFPIWNQCVVPCVIPCIIKVLLATKNGNEHWGGKELCRPCSSFHSTYTIWKWLLLNEQINM